MKNFILMMIFLVVGFSCSQKEDSIKVKLSDAEKIYGLSKFWQQAKFAFPYMNQIELDLDSAYVAFIPRVLNTKDKWEYYQELRKFAKLLKDGHTDLGNFRDITDPAHLLEHPAPAYLPIKFVVINKRLIVEHVRSNEPSAPVIGSELVKVNEVEIDKYLKEIIFPITISGTDQELWYEASLIVSTYGLRDTIQENKLTFKTQAGEHVDYYTKIKKYDDWKDREEWKAFRFKELENDIGYLQINTFSNDSIIKAFPFLKEKLLRKKGIIIDVRENSGGNSAIAIEIIKHFTEKDTIIGSKIKTLEFRPSFMASRIKKLPDDLNSYSEEDQKYYIEAHNIYHRNHWYDEGIYKVVNDIPGPKIKAPLVVLMGNHTISAAEDFLVMIDSNLEDQSIKIGDISFGSTGQPLFFSLPGGGLGRIVSVYNSYPNDKEFVGYGIEPDIYVKPKVEDIINKNDVVLERAIEILLSH